MSSNQFVQAKFGCRYDCGVQADCLAKPWHYFNAQMDQARFFAKCMKRCNFFPFMKLEQKLPCSDECLHDFKRLGGLDSSEEIILDNVDDIEIN